MKTGFKAEEFTTEATESTERSSNCGRGRGEESSPLSRRGRRGEVELWLIGRTVCGGPQAVACRGGVFEAGPPATGPATRNSEVLWIELAGTTGRVRSIEVPQGRDFDRTGLRCRLPFGRRGMSGVSRSFRRVAESKNW